MAKTLRRKINLKSATKAVTKAVGSTAKSTLHTAERAVKGVTTALAQLPNPTVYIVQSGGYLVHLPNGRSPRFTSRTEAQQVARELNTKMGGKEYYTVGEYDTHANDQTSRPKSTAKGKRNPKRPTAVRDITPGTIVRFSGSDVGGTFSGDMDVELVKWLAVPKGHYSIPGASPVDLAEVKSLRTGKTYLVPQYAVKVKGEGVGSKRNPPPPLPSTNTYTVYVTTRPLGTTQDDVDMDEFSSKPSAMKYVDAVKDATNTVALYKGTKFIAKWKGRKSRSNPAAWGTPSHYRSGMQYAVVAIHGGRVKATFPSRAKAEDAKSHLNSALGSEDYKVTAVNPRGTFGIWKETYKGRGIYYIPGTGYNIEGDGQYTAMATAKKAIDDYAKRQEQQREQEQLTRASGPAVVVRKYANGEVTTTTPDGTVYKFDSMASARRGAVIGSRFADPKLGFAELGDTFDVPVAILSVNPRGNDKNPNPTSGGKTKTELKQQASAITKRLKQMGVYKPYVTVDHTQQGYVFEIDSYPISAVVKTLPVDSQYASTVKIAGDVTNIHHGQDTWAVVAGLIKDAWAREYPKRKALDEEYEQGRRNPRFDAKSVIRESLKGARGLTYVDWGPESLKVSKGSKGAIITYNQGSDLFDIVAYSGMHSVPFATGIYSEQLADTVCKAISRRWAVGNPQSGSDSAYTAFHGVAPESVVEVTDMVHTHDHLAQIGVLVSMTLNTITGYKADVAFLTPAQASQDVDKLNRASNVVRVAVDEGDQVDGVLLSPSQWQARNLYLRGGNQDLTPTLDAVDMGPDSAYWRESILVGEIAKLTYRTRKDFDEFEDIDYYHKLGEETGERPSLVYDSRSQLMTIVGGQYTVEGRGIVN